MNESSYENVVTVRTAAAVSRVRAQRFSLLLTLLLIAVVVRGFWPTYFGPLLTGRNVARPWVMHLHGAIFSGWMLLLLGLFNPISHRVNSLSPRDRYRARLVDSVHTAAPWLPKSLNLQPRHGCSARS